MSIKPEHIHNISTGAKNHEYRKYLLPSSVKRIWFYTSTTVAAFQFVALISPGKRPGEVAEDGGIGNADFNAGRKVSKFGYEIRKLWQLRSPITLATARKRAYIKAPPQKYSWAPPNLLADYPLEKQLCVLDRRTKKRKLAHLTASDENDPSPANCVKYDGTLDDIDGKVSSTDAANAIENVTPEVVKKKRRIDHTSDAQLSLHSESQVHTPAGHETAPLQTSEQFVHSPVTEPDHDNKVVSEHGLEKE